MQECRLPVVIAIVMVVAVTDGAVAVVDAVAKRIVIIPGLAVVVAAGVVALIVKIEQWLCVMWAVLVVDQVVVGNVVVVVLVVAVVPVMGG